MSRVRRGFKARQRRNKILKLAKGFHFDRRRKYKITAETVKRALHYRYIGRRLLTLRRARSCWNKKVLAKSAKQSNVIGIVVKAVLLRAYGSENIP